MPGLEIGLSGRRTSFSQWLVRPSAGSPLTIGVAPEAFQNMPGCSSVLGRER